MSRIRRVHRKSTPELAAEWDAIATVRAAELDAGIDISFSHVLLPAIMKLAMPLEGLRVLDVGCGTGRLATLMGEAGAQVLGIDPSQGSIEHALSLVPQNDRVQFLASSVEDFALKDHRHFEVAIAHMVLMDVSDLESCLDAIFRLLRPGGRLIFSITHPWFWPEYWHYNRSAWFSYGDEIFIEAPFRITMDETSFTTTHVHRPLSLYLRRIRRAGFVVDELDEPVPGESAAALYPTEWHFPRFLVGRCLKEL